MSNADDAHRQRAAELRRQAESRLSPLPADLMALPPHEVQQLVHELAVHRIELEMQNQELREAQQQLEESRDRYADLYDLAPVGYVTLDRHGGIQQINLTAAAWLETERTRLVGRRFVKFMAEPQIEHFVDQLEQTFRTQGAGTLEACLLGAAGRGTEAQLDFVTTDQGQTCRMTLTDIARRKQAEAERQERDGQLRLALDAAKMGTWVWDLHNYMVSCSSRLGLPSGHTAETAVVGFDAWLADVHPEDRASVQRLIQEALAERGQIETQFRVCDAGGQVRWIAMKGAMERDEQGKPLRLSGVAYDVTAARELQQALEQAKNDANAANLAKSRFLANMSHELRTPMNAILGMVDVALPKAVNPTVVDCLQTVKESADVLLSLLNDLLDSAKIESGKLELDVAAFSLRGMLNQLTRTQSMRAGEKGLSFVCRVSVATPDAVVGDRIRLRQVLFNLVGNAIKFTKRGEVQLSVHGLPHEGHTSLEFAVRDTGIGILPADLERIFQPFSQAEASTARLFGGTGLGLFISKSLVQMMGGRIWAESESGQGSIFHLTVRLPVANELPVEVKAPTLVATPARTLRVLLVEDNPANRKLANYVLHERGHEVDNAEDGRKAVRLTESNAYDVILMDVQMPVMNGLEATAAIRKREAGTRRTPIIGMTALAMQSDRVRCLAVGMDGYLSKPVDALEMIGLVESLACGTDSLAPVPTATPRRADDAAPGKSLPQATVAVFDPEEALGHCGGHRALLRDMAQCLSNDVQNLFPAMRAALARGDLVEIGGLAHRLKGTLLHLGAGAAQEAAEHVEQFGYGGQEAPLEAALLQAELAINVLERECLALKAALAKYFRTADGAVV